MIARIHRSGLFSAFQRVVIGAMIIAGAGIFPDTLFSADKAADEVVEEAVEKAVEKAAEKAAEVATEKAELTAHRPDDVAITVE